jgi:hypothetical protein
LPSDNSALISPATTDAVTGVEAIKDEHNADSSGLEVIGTSADH